MAIRCSTCFGDKTVKNGRNSEGTQKYKCKDCGYSFVEHPKKTKISDQTKALVDRLLLEKLSLAGIARSTGVSETWLQSYVNNKYKNISKTIEPEKGYFRLIIECDEMWSYVGNKRHKQWIWLI